MFSQEIILNREEDKLLKDLAFGREGAPNKDNVFRMMIVDRRISVLYTKEIEKKIVLHELKQFITPFRRDFPQPNSIFTYKNSNIMILYGHESVRSSVEEFYESVKGFFPWLKSKEEIHKNFSDLFPGKNFCASSVVANENDLLIGGVVILDSLMEKSERLKCLTGKYLRFYGFLAGEADTDLNSVYNKKGETYLLGSADVKLIKYIRMNKWRPGMRMSDFFK